MNFQQPQYSNVSVTADTSRIVVTLKKMAMIIQNQSMLTEYPMDEADIVPILMECVNQYLGFILPSQPQGNIGFDFYLDEHFKALRKQFDSETETGQLARNYLNAHFTVAVSDLAQQLVQGVNHLNQNGYDVDAIKTFHMVPNKTDLFVLEGIQFEEQEILEEAPPVQAVSFDLGGMNVL